MYAIAQAKIKINDNNNWLSLQNENEENGHYISLVSLQIHPQRVKLFSYNHIKFLLRDVQTFVELFRTHGPVSRK